MYKEEEFLRDLDTNILLGFIGIISTEFFSIHICVILQRTYTFFLFLLSVKKVIKKISQKSLLST